MAKKKQQQQQTPDAELTKMVLREAADMATAIHKYIGSRPQLQYIGMTVVGYAIEMMIANAAKEINATGHSYDDMSANWREFMAQVHRDVRKLTAAADTQAQA